MFTRKTKFSVAAATVVALCAISAPVVLAVTADTDDSLSPANHAIAVKLKTATKAVFTGTVQGAPVTSTCTVSTTSFKTPAKGLGTVVTSNPTFTGCTDSLGGTDTVKTNSTTGTWKARFVDAPNDEAKEGPDHLQLVIPKGGATIVSSILPTCTITVAPAGPASVAAAYNDVSTATFSKSGIPTAGTGCTTSANGSFTATYTLSPGVKDVS